MSLEVDQPVITRDSSIEPEGADYVISYNPFHDEANEIRLVTILPVKKGASQSSRIRCHLEVVSLAEKFHTKSYGLYRSNTDDFKQLNSFASSNKSGGTAQERTRDGPVVISSDCDDATTKLPDFRYSWGDYMALSYTWGDPSITREIRLNGQLMRVTENVEACLRILRGKSYIKKGWRIWIDALCINQADIIERASQVKRMNEIYKKAWTPIIWIGDELEGSDGAMALAKHLACTYTGDEGVHALTQALHQDPERFGKGNWRALHQLINRRYWSRMWILQEAAMGRRDTPVLCGKHTLPWIYISRAFKLLNKTDEVLNKYMVNELKEAGLEYSLSTWSTFATVGEIQVLQDAQNSHKRGNLFRLLHLARTVSATDARDKVYGILEMMPPELFALVNPDYSANVFDVYLDFAWATIRASGSLDVIRHYCPTEEPSSYPSWLPNWVLEPNLSPLTFSNANFAASGTSKYKHITDTTPRGTILPCQGFKIDEFDGLGALWSKGWDSDTITHGAGSANPYGEIEDIQEAIWKTLVANRNLDGEPLSQNYSSLLATPLLARTQLGADDPLFPVAQSNVFAWCVKFLVNNSTLVVCGRPLSEYFFTNLAEASTSTSASSPGLPLIDSVELRDALMQRDHITVRRRFVTTRNGSTGMALENVRHGDGIYILHGCSVPVVLRPCASDENRKGELEFLGECYIHGVMEGEMMGKFDVEDIVLV